LLLKVKTLLKDSPERTFLATGRAMVLKKQVKYKRIAPSTVSVKSFF
jgi:hypothetical protein